MPAASHPSPSTLPAARTASSESDSPQSSPDPLTVKTGRQAERLSAILSAAERIFLEKGYEAASLDNVARQAGASKATIYSHFGNKMGLFKAIMGARLSAMTQPLKEAETTHASARDVLAIFGSGFLGALLSPVPLKFYKLIVSHAANFPGLAQTWFENGPRATIGTLANFLRERTIQGELEVQDPETAAEFFLMSLRGTLHIRALTKLIVPPFDDLIDAKVSAAVEMFMRAYGQRPHGGPGRTT